MALRPGGARVVSGVNVLKGLSIDCQVGPKAELSCRNMGGRPGLVGCDPTPQHGIVVPEDQERA